MEELQEALFVVLLLVCGIILLCMWGYIIYHA